MSLSLLPSATTWLALFAAAAFAWHRPQHGLSVGLAALGYACALAFGMLGPLALAPLALLAAAAWGVMPERPRAVRIAAHVVFAAIAIALSLHLIPGFHNPRVIGPTRFTPDAAPFTMYLNLDKPLVGLWLVWVLPWVAPDIPLSRALRTGAVAAVATAAACLAGALAFGMVGWAPKWPPSGWLWLVNNVLLVTLAEEGRTMIVVTHEMGFARNVSNHVMFLHQGRVEEEGVPSEVFANPKSERLRGFLSGSLK